MLEIVITQHRYSGEHYERRMSVADYARDAILESRRGEGTARLEDQPKQVAEALGALLALLLSKGVLSAEEFFGVVELSGGQPGNVRLAEVKGD